MEFFDAFNKKLNMQDIKKDISGLRNRILNDSSYFEWLIYYWLGDYWDKIL